MCVRVYPFGASASLIGCSLAILGQLLWLENSVKLGNVDYWVFLPFVLLHLCVRVSSASFFIFIL